MSECICLFDFVIVQSKYKPSIMMYAVCLYISHTTFSLKKYPIQKHYIKKNTSVIIPSYDACGSQIYYAYVVSLMIMPEADAILGVCFL